MSDIREADAAGQSFLYSGDERYLDSYHAALARTDARLTSLQGYLADDEAQSSQLAALARLVQAKSAALRERIAARRQNAAKGRNWFLSNKRVMSRQPICPFWPSMRRSIVSSRSILNWQNCWSFARLVV